jgi:hypothetical protein
MWSCQADNELESSYASMQRCSSSNLYVNRVNIYLLIEPS